MSKLKIAVKKNKRLLTEGDERTGYKKYEKVDRDQ